MPSSKASHVTFKIKPQSYESSKTSAASLLAFTVKQGLTKWAEHVKDKAKGIGHVPAAAKEAIVNFLAFVRYTFGAFEENWHHVDLATALQDFVDGKITRLIISMPPRHSKTEFCSRRLPAYIFGRNPKARIVGTSYGQKLADAISRDVRRIMEDPAYPFPKSQVRGKITDAYWEINEGEGYYLASGIAGSIGGYGASYAIIDDPYRDASEALSKTIRENVWEWFTSTLYPRLEKPGSILIVHTRWHEDDLIGRLLKQAKEDEHADQWTVINFEAIATQDEKHRKKGDALWPWQKTIEQLLKIKKTIQRWFDALYQGRPTADEGVTFHRDKLQIVPVLPSGIWKWVRYWDVASTKDGGDWTVGTLIGEHPQGDRATDGQWFVADVVRGQWGPEEVAAIIKQTADSDRAKGRHVRVREEEEGGSSGKAVIASRTKLLAGYDYKGVRSTGEKQLRWIPFATQVNAGNVRLLAAVWNADFIDELAKVPGAENDDQADSSSGAFNDIALGSAAMGMSVVTLKGFGNRVVQPGYKQR